MISFICIRYAKHPLFGPALDKNKPSTTRPDQWFLFWTVLIVLSVHLFFEHHMFEFGNLKSSEVDVWASIHQRIFDIETDFQFFLSFEIF